MVSASMPLNTPVAGSHKRGVVAMVPVAPVGMPSSYLPQPSTFPVGDFLVAEAFHGHEHQRGPLIGRQKLDRTAHLGERQTRLDGAHCGIRSQPLLRDIAVFLADLASPELIDPKGLHNPKHPAVEPGALLKLMLSRERPLARRLNKVVGLSRRTGEAAGKTPQARENSDQLIAEALAHRIAAVSRANGRFCLFPTERQRASLVLYSVMNPPAARDCAAFT
jgi:hypothetical protein